jgi:tetratricopeptide (TPR) repeat protein
MQRGAWTDAKQLFEKALATAEAMDPCPQLVAAQRHQGQLMLRMGDVDAAAVALRRAADIAWSMPTSNEYAPTVLALAELQHLQGLDDDARANASSALRAGGPVTLRIEIHSFFAELEIAAQNPRLAVPHVEAALHLAEQLGSPYLRGLARIAEAHWRVATAGHDSAAASFKAAVDEFRQARTPYEEALAQREYGRGPTPGDRSPALTSELELGLHQLTVSVD